MARLARNQLPNVPAHVVVRGNDRVAVFRSDGDRIFFHRCLVEAAARYGMKVHAYVFMTNHVHLLASGDNSLAISRTVQMLGRRYVSYFNYLHGRSGTLWEGRFRASPIETERYLFTCHRYIELNPVRAGMVSSPERFEWSSHRCLAEGKPDDLVTPHEMYGALAGSVGARRIAYRALFDVPLDSKTVAHIRTCLQKGIALGSAEFCRQLEAESGRRASPAAMGRPRKAGRERAAQLALEIP
jgi:putative transposase